MTDAADLDPGARVVDRDADPVDRDEAVVVNTPPLSADEWDVDGRTVAEYPGNEDYPASDPVACIVYTTDTDDTDRDLEDLDAPVPLAELDAPYYTFPSSRLRVVEGRESPEDVDATEDDDRGEGGTPDDTEEDRGAGPRHPRDTPADTSDDLAAIAAAVRERNVDGVTIDAPGGVVRVEKLGLMYTITRDGTVLDSGAFADALEDVAQAALDEGDEEEEGVVA